MRGKNNVWRNLQDYICNDRYVCMYSVIHAGGRVGEISNTLHTYIHVCIR